MNSLMQDIRYAARMLVRNPGFTVVAVLTLALGIGLTTAMFTVLNSVIFRPLSYPQADRIAAMYENSSDPLMLQDIDGWGEKLGSIDKITWFHQTESNLTGGGNPRIVQVGHVPSSFFDLFGLAPQAGRLFGSEDEGMGGPLVAVVSDSFQRSQFPGNENIIGEPVRVNDSTYTIVGVVDAGALFRTVRVWLPEEAQGAIDRNLGEPFRYYGRLRPDVGVAQARAELETIFPPSIGRSGRPRSRVRVYGLEEDVVGGRTRRGVYLFFGAASLVWLLVCGNLANLILSRMFDRQKELALRSALGAPRSRIIRQVLTETTLLSMLGGAVGLFLAYAGLAYLLALLGKGIPEAIEVGMDGTVLLFALTISLVTGWVFGVVPVLNVRNLSVAEVLKAGIPGGDSRRRILRNLLVTLQVTLALTLLSGAGLLIRSYFVLTAVDLGVRTNGVIRIEPNLLHGVYPPGEARSQYMEAVSRELELLPGVDSAGLAMFFPMGGTDVFVLIHADELPGQDLNFMMSFVDPGVLKAVGARLLAGRFLTPRDKEDRSAVALLSDKAAAEFGGPKRALGQWVGRPGAVRFQVVGVVAGILPRGPRSRVDGQLYAPQWVRDPALEGLLSVAHTAWIVHVTEKAPASANDLRRGIWTVDPNVPVKIQSMADKVDGSYYASNRRYATLFSLMGGTSLLIASLGLYGVLSFAVGQRTRVIGETETIPLQGLVAETTLLRQSSLTTGPDTVLRFVADLDQVGYANVHKIEMDATVRGDSSRDSEIKWIITPEKYQKADGTMVDIADIRKDSPYVAVTQGPLASFAPVSKIPADGTRKTPTQQEPLWTLKYKVCQSIPEYPELSCLNQFFIIQHDDASLKQEYVDHKKSNRFLLTNSFGATWIPAYAEMGNTPIDPNTTNSDNKASSGWYYPIIAENRESILSTIPVGGLTAWMIDKIETEFNKTLRDDIPEKVVGSPNPGQMLVYAGPSTVITVKGHPHTNENANEITLPPMSDTDVLGDDECYYTSEDPTLDGWHKKEWFQDNNLKCNGNIREPTENPDGIQSSFANNRYEGDIPLLQTVTSLYRNPGFNSNTDNANENPKQGGTRSRHQIGRAIDFGIKHDVFNDRLDKSENQLTCLLEWVSDGLFGSDASAGTEGPGSPKWYKCNSLHDDDSGEGVVNHVHVQWDVGIQ